MVSVHAVATYHRCCILSFVNYLINYFFEPQQAFSGAWMYILIKYCTNIVVTRLYTICSNY